MVLGEGSNILHVVICVTTKTERKLLKELVIVKQKEVLLLGLGNAELFDRMVEHAQEPLELVGIADECPGQGVRFSKASGSVSVTDEYYSQQQLGLFIKPKARDPTCTPTLE